MMMQEDYQRMMMQQQQGQAQAVRAMAQSPAFGQQGWGQQQQQQQERQQQQQLQQQQQFGMSPPGSAVGAPSPPNSHNWNGAQYPFSSSSPVGGGGIGEMQQLRHLSATPVPQQQRQTTPQNMTSPPTAENETDWFNWQ